MAAPFHGDAPPPGPPRPFFGLWEHEVLEIFLAGPRDHYLEVELSPHGHTCVLRLAGVRHVVQRDIAIPYRARVAGDRWRGEATLPNALIPPGPHRINAFAMGGPDRLHLAYRPVLVPARWVGDTPMPDFHQLRRFAPLRLPRHAPDVPDASRRSGWAGRPGDRARPLAPCYSSWPDQRRTPCDDC